MADKVLEKILELVKTISNTRLTDERLLEINLFHYGVIDSLMIMHLIIQLEELYGIQILSP